MITKIAKPPMIKTGPNMAKDNLSKYPLDVSISSEMNIMFVMMILRKISYVFGASTNLYK